MPAQVKYRCIDTFAPNRHVLSCPEQSGSADRAGPQSWAASAFTPSEAAALTYQMPQCWITLLLPVSLRSLATPAPSGPASAGHLSGWVRRISRVGSTCQGIAHAPNIEGEKQARLSAQENASHKGEGRHRLRPSLVNADARGS